MNDSVYLDVESVKSWFSSDDYLTQDEIDELLTELPWDGEGSIFELPGVTDFQLQIVFNATERQYDSYGNKVLDDGYIVFSATGMDGTSVNFKLPYTYQSYDGWNYFIDKITKVEKHQKVVTTWEWVNV